MPDPTSVAGLVHRLLASWNAGDPPAFGRLFDPDADYVGGDGVWRRGRASIEGMCPTTRDSPRVALQGDIAVRIHGPAATALFRWVAEGGRGDDRRGVISLVVVNGDDGPWITQLQNTDFQGVK